MSTEAVRFFLLKTSCPLGFPVLCAVKVSPAPFSTEEELERNVTVQFLSERKCSSELLEHLLLCQFIHFT